MKRLSVLVIIMTLLLSSVSLAVLAIQPAQTGTGLTEITVNVNDIYYVDLIWQNDEIIPVNGELSAADIHFMISGPASIVDLANLTFNADYIDPTGLYNGSQDLANGKILSVTSWNDGANPGELVIGNIGLQCTGVGNVIITTNVGLEIQGLSIVDWETIIDPESGGPGLDEAPMIIHQMPEPMTLVLLGLGGLYLRRRK